MRHLRAALVGAAILFLLSGSPAATFGPSLGPAMARAASPEPSADSGDTRSSGEAPGFVGSPLSAIAAVLAIGVLAVAGTILYVRLTGGPGRAADDNPTAPRR